MGMPSLDFNGTTLYISARSPFARRVRLALLEHGIRYEEKVFDVFKPNPELTQANPLARVPALVFPNGETVVDSHLILQLLYDTHSESPFHPRNAQEKLQAARWSGIAVGLCEKAVEYYLEKLRPEAQRDPEVFTEADQAVERTLSELEQRIQERDSLLGTRLTQADLDLGTALTYLSLRHSTAWRERFPECARYVDGLELRESFRKTFPPR